MPTIKQMVMCNQINEKKKCEEKIGKYNPIESYLNKFPSASVEEKKIQKHTHTLRLRTRYGHNPERLSCTYHCDWIKWNKKQTNMKQAKDKYKIRCSWLKKKKIKSKENLWHFDEFQSN